MRAVVYCVYLTVVCHLIFVTNCDVFNVTEYAVHKQHA